jgi:mannose/fructose-specific phosphotransferase system component IIA
MSVGIVIVTHGTPGHLARGRGIHSGESMAEIGFVPFRQSGDQQTTRAPPGCARTRATRLVLTDLMGASPRTASPMCWHIPGPWSPNNPPC